MCGSRLGYSMDLGWRQCICRDDLLLTRWVSSEVPEVYQSQPMRSNQLG